MNIIMSVIVSIVCGILISAILIAIVDINMKKFLNLKNIDVETHNTGLLIQIETEGKDKKDYDVYLGKIYLIFIVIFSIASYIILPIL